uniref:Uncharacterized protein n=1 Tax=Timema genevievae TaxID=629358 RepID=A0A7R9K6X9_TIMGE|nr:unnamed protein product [Timema genevievae]
MSKGESSLSNRMWPRIASSLRQGPGPDPDPQPSQDIDLEGYVDELLNQRQVRPQRRPIGRHRPRHKPRLRAWCKYKPVPK